MKLDTNFKYLGVAPINDIVTLCESLLTETDWLECTERQETYASHSRTQSIQLIWPIDNTNLETVVETKLYPRYIKFLKPTLEYFQKEVFAGCVNPKIMRLVLTRLDPHSDIPLHTDNGYSLQSVHRCHIAIVTNADCIFTVGGEEKQMAVGDVWEISNTMSHQVDNNGDAPRIHLMIDWM